MRNDGLVSSGSNRPANVNTGQGKYQKTLSVQTILIEPNLSIIVGCADSVRRNDWLKNFEFHISVTE